MGEWLRLAFDGILIALIGAGLVQATRLIRYLSDLDRGRVDMERFVKEFNATVSRAENGIKSLRFAARESGDDLEKLVDKAVMVRDELHFLVESADQIAERLSQSATGAIQSVEREAEIVPIQKQRVELLQAPAQREAAKTSVAPSPAVDKPVFQATTQRPVNVTQNTPKTPPTASALSSLASKIAEARAATKISPAATSRAEQELLQALQNLR